MKKIPEPLIKYLKKGQQVQQRLAAHPAGHAAKKVAKGVIERMAQGANRLLVIESRGFGINAYVVERRGEVVELVHFASNGIANSADALADVCLQFKSQQCPVPNKVLLISGAVASALLPLPIDKEKKLSDKQMQELVRWELEPLFAENIGQWTIGGLLIACGYLDEPQRKQLLEELGEQKERMAGRGGRAPARFGELAIKAKFITQEQLDECLTIHEKNQLVDPAIECSWSDDAVASEDQGGQWLCSAMNAQSRTEWLGVFAGKKMKLEGIYSQHHSATSQLPIKSKEQWLLVINISLVTLIKVEKNIVVASKQHRCSDYALTGEAILTLLKSLIDERYFLAESPSEKDGQYENEQYEDEEDDQVIEKITIYHSGYHPRINELTADLAAQMAGEFLSLDGVLDLNGVVDNPFSGDAAIMGAARHYWYKFSTQQLSRLQGTPPPPPLYKQPKMQVAAITSLLILGISSNEALYAYEKSSTEIEIRENGLAVEKIETINSKINSDNVQYNKLKQQKEGLQGKVLVLNKRQVIMNTILLERQRFLSELLLIISNSSNDLLYLSGVSEQSWYHFSVSGWASTQLSVDEFNKKLTAELEEWDMQVTNSSSREELNNLAGEGYRFSLTMEPM